MSLRLRRTDFPETLKHNGTPLGRYWFEVEGEAFGVSVAQYDHGIQWEVFHGDTCGEVRDDWDRLKDLRREAVEECQRFLGDLRREEEEERRRQ